MSRLVTLIAVLALVAACGKSQTAPTPPSAPFSQVDLVVGTGASAENGRSISVLYTLWLYDPARPDGKGTQLESNPFTFVLGVGQVIKGWDQGVLGMRVGGQRRLTIPPNLAYGNRSNGNVPANSTLVFDIALTAVQ